MNLLSPFFLILISVMPLLAVYISQFFFGMEPCILCIYQRIPYFLIIAVNIIAFFVKKRSLKKVIICFSILALLTGAGIALFHVGVEKGRFIMDCYSAVDTTADIDDLRKILMGKPTVPCDKPQFVFLHISMAGWNFLYSGFLAFLLTFKFVVIARKKTLFQHYL